MSIFRDEKIWRFLTNFWTLVFMVFLVFNFFMQDKYESFIAPMSVIYIGILGLYVGTKEFDRWYEMHSGRHPGEWFVIYWTVVMFALMVVAFFSDKKYHLSSEAVAVYIMVLSVFALTQKSKSLHAKKSGKPIDLDE